VPLTLLTDCPPEWASENITFKQGQTQQTAEVVSKDGLMYIKYNALPDMGIIELSIESPVCIYDLDGNGSLDYGDIIILTENWLSETMPNNCDLNGDMRVDFADYTQFINFWTTEYGQ